MQDDIVSILPIRCKMFEYLCRIAYTLQNMSTSLSLMVVAAYWILLGRHSPVTCLAIQQHGITSMLNTTDFIISSNRNTFKDTFYKPIVVGVGYTLFSLIYCQFDLKPLYKYVYIISSNNT